jgi:hypothetical protein
VIPSTATHPSSTFKLLRQFEGHFPQEHYYSPSGGLLFPSCEKPRSLKKEKKKKELNNKKKNLENLIQDTNCRYRRGRDFHSGFRLFTLDYDKTRRNLLLLLLLPSPPPQNYTRSTTDEQKQLVKKKLTQPTPDEETKTRRHDNDTTYSRTSYPDLFLGPFRNIHITHTKTKPT